MSSSESLSTVASSFLSLDWGEMANRSGELALRAGEEVAGSEEAMMDGGVVGRENGFEQWSSGLEWREYYDKNIFWLSWLLLSGSERTIKCMSGWGVDMQTRLCLSCGPLT